MTTHSFVPITQFCELSPIKDVLNTLRCAVGPPRQLICFRGENLIIKVETNFVNNNFHQFNDIFPFPLLSQISSVRVRSL